MSYFDQDAPLAGYGMPSEVGFGTPESYQYLAPLNVQTNGYNKSLVVKTGPGVLYGFSAYNSNVAAQFILLFDVVTVPAAGAVPAIPFSIGATANLGLNWLPGRPFRTGCVLVVSSTAPTYTAAAANDVFIDAQFL